MPINATGPTFVVSFTAENAAWDPDDASAGMKVPLSRKMAEGRSLESLERKGLDTDARRRFDARGTYIPNSSNPFPSQLRCTVAA